MNEQTPFTLRRTLTRCGMTSRIQMVPLLRQVDGKALRILYAVLGTKPWAYVTSAEIVAICRKR